VRSGRAADHSPPSSATVMEEKSYNSTHPLGHAGPVTGSLSCLSRLHGVLSDRLTTVTVWSHIRFILILFTKKRYIFYDSVARSNIFNDKAHNFISKEFLLMS